MNLIKMNHSVSLRVTQLLNCLWKNSTLHVTRFGSVPKKL